MRPSSDALTELPKVELHDHLEGTIGGDRIAELAARAGAPLPRPVDRIFETGDLAELLALLDWIGSLVTAADVAAELAHDFAVRAQGDGIRYAEVIVNPSHWGALPLPDVLAGVADGFERAAADGLPDCRILVSILRRQSAAEAEAIATYLTEHAPRRVVALSVDGDERAAGRTAPRFARAYRIAGEAGLGRTAHAGESSGAEGVRDAVDVLRVDRIDHGVRATEDPRLVARRADEPRGARMQPRRRVLASRGPPRVGTGGRRRRGPACHPRRVLRRGHQGTARRGDRRLRGRGTRFVAAVGG